MQKIYAGRPPVTAEKPGRLEGMRPSGSEPSQTIGWRNSADGQRYNKRSKDCIPGGIFSS